MNSLFRFAGGPVVALMAVAYFGRAQTVTRTVAPWPPKQAIRVIIDTDAGAEVDDQHALALALGFPERVKIEGLVAAHFGDFGGPGGVQKSLEEVERVLEKAGQNGRIPVKRGAEPFVFRDQPPDSEGVRFIIERARTATYAEPLWLVLLGPATDAAAALLHDPSIGDRMVVFWHGRTQWPLRCWNYNVWNDIKAARLLFDLPCRLVLFDTGTYLRIPLEESARRFQRLGPLGDYLYAIRSRSPSFLSDEKSMFDLGDIAALVDPNCVRWERTEAPAVDYDLRYDFSKKQGQMVRIYHVERDRAFDLLEESLRRIVSRSRSGL